MKSVKIAEDLADMLQNYANEVEEGEHEQHQDDYIVDGICDMQEILYKSGSEEGRYYESFMLSTDKVIKVFETVEVERFMSGTKEKLKVMSILEVKPLEGKQIMIEFLGAKIKE